MAKAPYNFLGAPDGFSWGGNQEPFRFLPEEQPAPPKAPRDAMADALMDSTMQQARRNPILGARLARQARGDQQADPNAPINPFAGVAPANLGMATPRSEGGYYPIATSSLSPVPMPQGNTGPLQSWADGAARLAGGAMTGMARANQANRAFNDDQSHIAMLGSAAGRGVPKPGSFGISGLFRK